MTHLYCLAEVCFPVLYGRHVIVARTGRFMHKVPLIIGLFGGKRRVKIRHPIRLCHPVSRVTHSRLAIYAEVVCGIYLSLHIAHSMSEWALCHPVWRHIVVARTGARFCSRPKPKETYMREKRRTHQKRDSCMRKKTYLWEKRHICDAPAQIQKRHVCEKRDLHTTKETIIHEKRDSYMRKKTCLYAKRCIREETDLFIR